MKKLHLYVQYLLMEEHTTWAKTFKTQIGLCSTTWFGMGPENFMEIFYLQAPVPEKPIKLSPD